MDARPVVVSRGRKSTNAAEGPAVAYLVLRFPLVTETFVLRELSAVADRVAFPIELFRLRAGRAGTVHPMATRWLPVVQTASIARGCVEFVRLLITRPVPVLRVIRDVVFDYAGDLRALVRALAAVVLAASLVPAARRGRAVPRSGCGLPQSKTMVFASGVVIWVFQSVMNRVTDPKK